MRSLLQTIARVVLVVALAMGIGLVVAYVLAGISFEALVIGASVAVLSWHGLRRIGPRPEEERPPEGWGWLGWLGAYAAIVAVGIWNPWLVVAGWGVLALVALVRWRRRRP